jgi:hypothetical protein
MWLALLNSREYWASLANLARVAIAYELYKFVYVQWVGCWDETSQQTFDLTIYKMKNFVKCSNNISNKVEFDQKNLINAHIVATK